MSQENKKSKLNWARKGARKEAIENLHRQALTITFDEAGRHAWNLMAKDEQAEFLRSKKLPDDFEFSHLFGASEYPEIAHSASTGRLTTYLDHRYGDHGGNTQIPLHGSPRDPNWRDSWGTQEIDATKSSGQKYLGMSETEQTCQSRLDAELKKDYPQLEFKTSGQATNESSQVVKAIDTFGVFPGCESNF